jgi:hypothetical protein
LEGSDRGDRLPELMARSREPRQRSDQELFERHRPLLLVDRQYDYRVLAAESAVENQGNLLRRLDGEVIARARRDPELSLDLLTGYPAGLEAGPDDASRDGPRLPRRLPPDGAKRATSGAHLRARRGRRGPHLVPVMVLALLAAPAFQSHLRP